MCYTVILWTNATLLINSSTKGISLKVTILIQLQYVLIKRTLTFYY